MTDRVSRNGRRLVACGVGLVLLLSGIGAAPSSAQTEGAGNQPDLLIRKSGAANFAGDGIYNTTAAGQSKTRRAARGATVLYDVRVQNDGPEAATITLTGCASNTRFRVRYFIVTDIGTIYFHIPMTTGGHPITLDPEESFDFFFEVKVKAGAPAGATLNCKVRAATGSSLNVLRDAVKLTVQRT